MNGVGNIIKNYQNIIINKIKIKDKEKELKTDNYNNEGEKLYKILRSLYELKNHCRDLHNKIINNCIINYTLAENNVEIEHGNKIRYIINLNDMYEKDNTDILKQMRGGFNLFNNYININKIKIIGENILTLSREN